MMRGRHFQSALHSALHTGLLVLRVVVPLGLAACATDPDDLLADEEAEKRSLHGWVIVERDEGDGRVRSNVSAKFLQVADGDVAIAQRLIGTRPQVPAAGDCVPLDTIEDGLAVDARPTFPVDLVDVGDVSLAIHAEQREGAEDDALVMLAPRAFPDIGDFVSGVVYSTPDATMGLPVSAEYELGAKGSALVDSFVLEVRAPAALRLASVAGQAPEEDDAIEVTAGSDIELAWDPPSAQSLDETSLIYVDIKGLAAHRCTFPDGGGAVLPPGMLQSGERATIRVHRLAERSATLRDESGEAEERLRDATIVFDLASTVQLSVR